jgi:hypothetical protein
MTGERRALDRSTIPWLAAGTAFLLLVFLLAWHFRGGASPAEELARKASRVDLVGQLQVALAAAAEAEKSAVLATSDEESQTFADQARAATREAERERRELDQLLATGGTKRERDLLSQFSEAFGQLQRVDEEVLGLAVKNTNLKAYRLAFGPAAVAGAEFDAALSSVASGASSAPDSQLVRDMAFQARLALLRIQTLLPPHIAEENDAEMDRLEASMATEEARVRQSVAGLAGLPSLRGSADLAAATASLARFIELKTRILGLSRENTNVRSLAVSLNQKRKAMLVCLEALGALRQAILDEPIAGVTYGRSMYPR